MLIPNRLGGRILCARCDGGKQLIGYDASLLACAIAFGSVFVREAQI
jgi:hypothetical protein